MSIGTLNYNYFTPLSQINEPKLYIAFKIIPTHFISKNLLHFSGHKATYRELNIMIGKTAPANPIHSIHSIDNAKLTNRLFMRAILRA